jgi:hypothetical protein
MHLIENFGRLRYIGLAIGRLDATTLNKGVLHLFLFAGTL